MRSTDEITHNGKTLTEILRLHVMWINGEDGGERADLTGADLTRANLTDAKTNYSTIGYNLACPEEGSFIAFKRVGSAIVKMLVPAEAKRSSATTRKCRFEWVKVLEITQNEEQLTEVVNSDRDDTLYRVGEITRPDSFNENRWDECSNGIHGFITRHEAETYQ